MATPVDSDQSSSQVYPDEDGPQNREWKFFGKVKNAWKKLELDMPTLLLMMKYALDIASLCVGD